MPRTDSDLRDLFAASDAPASAIDTKAVITRARRRRLPRQIGAGAVGALAIAGIAVIGIPLTQLAPDTSVSTMESAPDEGSASNSALEIKRAPAERLNLCTAPVAEFVPNTSGLRLEVVFPEVAPTGTAPILGEVNLTNTGSTYVTGSTAPTPAITVSQGGVVLWHSNGPVDASAVEVALAPGETLKYAASFVPVRCGVDDDLAEQFRPDLPPLVPGTYRVTAAIDFLPSVPVGDGSTPGLDLVMSEADAIDLE